MKNKIAIVLVCISMLVNVCIAQTTNTAEKHGMVLNLNAGLGYYFYVGRTLPVTSINFQFDVFKNFTLAPAIGMYSFNKNYLWRDSNLPIDTYRYYTCNVTVIPIGVKGTYYFDELLNASSKWDIYTAVSTGFLYTFIVWEQGYRGNVNEYKASAPLYFALHVGGAYHLNHRAALVADLSTNVSSIGIAINFKK